MLDDAREETVSQIGNGEPGTKEAEALASALNHSAERVQTLWFSFLTVMLYLAAATGTTTHRMLLLESPLKLPTFNIDLPLLGFFFFTPPIFVVFHFYVLLNLVLLARTARAFEVALERALPEDGEERETFRMRIENTLFAQLLAGGRLEREGINAKFLSLMALITLALAPALLLLIFEVKFLPYHSAAITWLHRGLLVLDLALVWTLWPGYRSGWGVRLWPKATWWLVVPGVGSAAAFAYAVAVATFPDEPMYLATEGLHGFAPINILFLPYEDLIDDSKLARILKKNESATDAQRWVATLSLEERDLTGANLEGADVRHVDFDHAILKRADLSLAWAEKAHFDNNAQLQGASLWGAQLQGAELYYAQLQGTELYDAQLQGAALDFAQLQGASLNQTHLQGAALNQAHLQGASLNGAQLQGASLNGAQLQGASLDNTQLQGASLVRAHLQGASLNGAQLQGASLDFAQLQGASLGYAPLWGLLIGGAIGGAQLQGASFVDACVWRADARRAAWEDTRVELPKADKLHECDWTAASFAALKQFVAEKVPESDDKRAAMERIERSLDPTKGLEGEDEMAKIWGAREHESPTPEAYEQSLAEQWRMTGCAAEGAPYVLHSLIARLSSNTSSPFRDQSLWAKQLASDFLYENCAGALGLSEADKAKLKKIAPQRLK